jgi:geranylgeranyl pyrophosphate synthase
VVGEDIHEGKRSLMVLHCLSTATPEKSARLLEILNQRTNDVALIQEAIALIKETDSITHARGVAKEIVEKAWNDIEPLLPENDAKTKLKVFADYLINRQI